MINDPIDSQILTQEQQAIELLARETHTAISKVQETFLSEYAKIAPDAHIKAFLPLLISHRVRAILGEENEANDRIPKP